MTRDQQRLADYLTHIQVAIERIHRYVEDIDEAAFLQSEMARDTDPENSPSREFTEPLRCDPGATTSGVKQSRSPLIHQTKCPLTRAFVHTNRG